MKWSELVPKRGGVKRRRKVEATDLIRRIQSRAHQRKGGEGADSFSGTTLNSVRLPRYSKGPGLIVMLTTALSAGGRPWTPQMRGGICATTRRRESKSRTKNARADRARSLKSAAEEDEVKWISAKTKWRVATSTRGNEYRLGLHLASLSIYNLNRKCPLL